MSKKFHVNKKGEVGSCTADVNECPIGGGSELHFSTRDEARSHFEKSQSTFGRGLLTKFKKRGTKVKVLAVSGALAASFSTSACDIDMSDVEKQVDEYSESQEGGNSDADPNEVRYQGKELKPSAEEVEEAKTTIKNLKVEEELFVTSNEEKNPDVVYDRSEQFGGDFNTGVVSEMEKRDIPSAEFEEKYNGERAVRGSFIDPYTGQKVEIDENNRNDTNVDHVIPLKEVVESGGLDSINDPNKIANDPENIQIVSGPVNQSKSDKDAGEYLPSYDPAKCIYVVSQINIKGKYALSIDSKEEQAMKDVINNRC